MNDMSAKDLRSIYTNISSQNILIEEDGSIIDIKNKTKIDPQTLTYTYKREMTVDIACELVSRCMKKALKDSKENEILSILYFSLKEVNNLSDGLKKKIMKLCNDYSIDVTDVDGEPHKHNLSSIAKMSSTVRNNQKERYD